MLETKINYTSISMISEGLSAGCSEVSRLLAAAVINPGFCQLLLNEPELAIKNGFQGEDFLFTEEEREMIASIQADSLSGLAKQLARIFFGNSNPLYETSHSAEYCFQIVTDEDRIVQQERLQRS